MGDPITALTAIGLKLSASIAAKALEKAFSSLTAIAGGKAKLALKRWRNRSAVSELANKLLQVRLSKTLLFIDEAKPLEDFYYPSKVLVAGSATEVGSIDTLPPGKNYVVEGTVGQGKSVFLRYLCLKELQKGERIPIFFELRRVAFHGSLSKALWQTLVNYGFELDDELFDFYANSGRLVLFLDGYDEISEELHVTVTEELETLCQRYPELCIVVSSRPNAGLEASVYFRILKLAPLEKKDRRPFLQRVMRDEQQVDLLMTAIQKSHVAANELLTTPLTLSLLVLVYRSEYDVPVTLAAFYSKLFWAIVGRHEKGKLGPARRRYCKLGDTELENLFRVFCIVSKQQGVRVFDEATFNECARLAAQYSRQECDPAEFRKDIVKNVCLLQQDGWEFKFVHPSVQEYYAASFVANEKDEVACRFYEKALSESVWPVWQVEISFLVEIDRYRYLKHFLVPQLAPFLQSIGTIAEPAKQEELVLSLAKNISLFFARTNGDFVIETFSFGDKISYVEYNFRLRFLSALIEPRYALIANTQERVRKQFENAEPNVKRVSIPLESVILAIRDYAGFLQQLTAFVGEDSQKLDRAIQVIAREEAKIEIFGLGLLNPKALTIEAK